MAAILIVGLIALAAAAGVGFAVRRYRVEQAEVQRVRAMFSRYVPPQIVEEILRRKDPRLYTGRQMHATIMVCRIWNFPGFAEALTPDETLRYVNEFYAIAGTSIQKNRGMIDKFVSDGIIGVFGVPLEDPFQEEHALRAALDIVRLVDAMDKRWQAQGRRSIQVGIGINSGKVIAGDTGFNDRREFTVVGPETMLASRLQEATYELNAFIVASAATCNVVADQFTLVPIKGVPLPGLKRLTDAFIVRGLKRAGKDDLKMPGNESFVNTRVEGETSAAQTSPPPSAPPAPPPAATESPRARPVAAPPPRESPPPPEITPSALNNLADPPPPMRRRPRTLGGMPASQAPLDLPELRIPRFRERDEAPIMPDPPPPRAIYEDGEGPPMQLPP
jgi:class 3 adenylate cyclase